MLWTKIITIQYTNTSTTSSFRLCFSTSLPLQYNKGGYHTSETLRSTTNIHPSKNPVRPFTMSSPSRSSRDKFYSIRHRQIFEIYLTRWAQMKPSRANFEFPTWAAWYNYYHSNVDPTIHDPRYVWMVEYSRRYIREYLSSRPCFADCPCPRCCLPASTSQLLMKVRSQIIVNWLAPILKEWITWRDQLQRWWAFRAYQTGFDPVLRGDLNRNGYIRVSVWYTGTDSRYTLMLVWLYMDEPLDSIVDWKRRWGFDVELVGWVFLNL